MTEFDELIRNKVEQAEYPCKPSAWKRFAKQSGLQSGVGTLKIVAVSVMAAAVIGGATWAVISHQSHPASDPIAETVVNTDSVTIVSPETETVEHATSKVTGNPTTIVKTTSETQTHTAERVVQESAQPVSQPSAVKPVKKTTTTTRPLGRPVIINVDTITDFEPTDEQLRNGHSRLF